MRTKRENQNLPQSGYSLLIVMILTGISIGLYASLAQLSSSSSLLNDRNNTFNSAVAAAEGASEIVLSYLARDFANQSFDPANLGSYRSQIPTEAWAAGYQFSDGVGGTNQTAVYSSPTMVLTNLDSQFLGLYGLVFNCQVRSCASPVATPYHMTASVRQNIQLATIPVFQFAIFYAMDLEVNPGPIMKVTGKVHSNASIYTAPGSGLEYADDVTAVGKIYNSRMPGDPTGGGKVAPVFDKEHMDNTSSLSLPIGSNNTPAGVHAILEVPPFGENPNSPTGQQRYYNKADLVVTTTPTNVLVQAGNWDAFVAIAPDLSATSNSLAQYSFIKTNGGFYDQREEKNTVVTEIDVGRLGAWITNAGAMLNSQAKFQIGHQINSIYVNDLRTGSGAWPVVRVSNGQQLPPDGLTVATPLPLYVQGHFNAPDTTIGSTNTSQTKPASLLGDAITVLSGNWLDTNSTKSLSSRSPVDTTVNAAFLAGIVQTTNAAGAGHYSGGVENFPRFLENWSGKNFTYNGSMVVMFPSQSATNFWVQTGTYYNAPNRRWAFDVNFLDYHKLPPATPQVRKLVRGQWNVVAAN